MSKSIQPIPPGHENLIPHLVCSPAAEAIEFYKKAFGAEEIHRILRPDGSFVMELGGAWNPGSGTRSLFTYELLVRLGKLFHLAQDFYWFNPSRLPTP